MMKKNYQKPDFTVQRIVTEQGICAGSKEDVVQAEKTEVDIEQQENGGDYKFDTWD